jgi:hypothetical protein
MNGHRRSGNRALGLRCGGSSREGRHLEANYELAIRYGVIVDEA